MNRWKRIVLVVSMMMWTIDAFAQQTGDYGTAAAGPANWSAAASWVICVTAGGFGDATPASSAPTGSENIFIRSGHTITVDVAVSNITGYIKNSGTISIGAGSLTFSTGTYEHALDGGTIPAATWGTGSTCLVTGIVGTSPGGSNQNFHHFTWNCASQSGNRGCTWNGNTIGGNVTLSGSNANQVRMTSVTGTVTITINGDIIITSGLPATNKLTASGSSTLSNITLNVNGNLNIQGGFFSISDNSTNVITTCNLYGNVSISNASFGKSNNANSSRFYFAKSGTQTFSASSATFSSSPNFTVNSGSTLSVGTSVIGGSGSFVVLSGGGLATGHANGLNGSITASGVNGGGNSFSTGGNYTYNGTSTQVTGSFLPATVNNLTINNLAGVTNSQAVTVNGTLNLLSGVFDNSVNAVTVNGTINNGGGSLENPLPVELTSFSASGTRNGIELRWSTATEVNNRGFEVEKQVNGVWTSLGFVNGAGTSNERHDYSYTDRNVKTAASYRLQQVDRDGASHYSAIVDAQPASLTAADFGLSQNYPNPFNPATTLTFALRTSQKATVKVYDMLGKEVASLFNGVAEANQLYTLRFDAAHLPSGIYFYALQSAGRTEIKKMTLLK